MTAPAAFIAHGAPTLALEEGSFPDMLRALGRRWPRPRAIAVVSAHWETHGAVLVTGSARPRLIHDFGGFPEALYRLTYPAPGAPDVAAAAVHRLSDAGLPVGLDPERGLDHGAWVPLRIGWPDASVPVAQVSLPAEADPEDLLRFGAALAPLRDEGVLLLGTGGVVHNLYEVDLGHRDRAPDRWALAFDGWIADRLEPLDLPALLAYRERAPHAERAVPTGEHLAPLFVVLGARRPGERIETLFTGIQYGSLAMRSFLLPGTDASPKGTER